MREQPHAGTHENDEFKHERSVGWLRSEALRALMRSYIFVERLGFLTYAGCQSYFGDFGGSQVNFLDSWRSFASQPKKKKTNPTFERLN